MRFTWPAPVVHFRLESLRISCAIIRERRIRESKFDIGFIGKS